MLEIQVVITHNIKNRSKSVKKQTPPIFHTEVAAILLACLRLPKNTGIQTLFF